MVTVDPSRCGTCGGCVGVCPVAALNLAENRLLVDQAACTDCGLCLPSCPVGALFLDFAQEQATGPTPIRASYDLVVIGAGPGGSLAACAAARAGLSVLLLEKRQEIGSAVRCAEGVGHGPLTQHIAPDPRWIAATVSAANITVVESGRRKRTLHHSGATGYILERRIFDQALAQGAAAAGAQVATKTPVVGLIREGGRVVGVRALWRGQEKTIAARAVVAADGVESLAARWAGLDTSLPLHDTMSCAQYLLTGIDIDPACCAYFVGQEIAPGGYIWIFPKGPGRANVGIGVQADLNRRPALHYLTDFVASTPALAQGSIVAQIFGVVPVAAPSARLVADGLLVVGDAARQVDPLTGGGITNAMTAGHIAGQVAAQACARGDTSAAGLADYPVRFREALGRRLERNYRLKERYGPSARIGEDFLKIFALAAAGS